ncbi:MAG: D-alanyl-D-alanine carboxypeptidase [Clostridia bacterium]|nr:D-alanyl-D-alanine carboxypeptidase [Clostridia bacterium]MBP3706819.1 D-alanyl-D-alanine carboxypeptidase [Clostridia bacterium]
MFKRIISLFSAIVLIFCIVSIPANAYDPTGFDIDAKVALLASLDTDEVLYSKDADKKVYPASITKIMTATLILESEKYSPDKKIAMTEEVLKLISGTGSVVSNFKAGEEFTHLDLVYTVLMTSFGDCTYLAAIEFGGSIEGFVDMMNDKARQLGLKGTHYQNPVGLHDENNYTTATDTLILTKYALKNKTFREVCETTRYTISTNFTQKRTLTTTNYLQDPNTNYYYSYAKGVKTGFTDEAGRCLVSTASYDGYNYICILFGCTAGGDRRYEFVDSKNLYRWAFNNFEFKTVANTSSPVYEVAVTLSSQTDFVPLYVEKSFVSVLPKEADDSTIEIKPKPFKQSVQAPIKKGDILGTADIIYAEQVIGTVNLVAGEDVEKSPWLAVGNGIKNFFNSVYMKILFVLLGIAILIFIISVIRLNSGRRKKRKVKYIPYNESEEKNNDVY